MIYGAAVQNKHSGVDKHSSEEYIVQQYRISTAVKNISCSGEEYIVHPFSHSCTRLEKRQRIW